MFAHKDLKDFILPAKTLCLTYDDGPGMHTPEIGRFLNEQGVRATFFVVGKFAVHHADILDNIHQQGHIIGNHTFEHPDMPYYVSVNGDIRDQIIRTNTLISKYNIDRPIFFRAPYGKWSPEVADELNLDIRSSYRHVGPVYWEIPGIDCYYWKLGKSVDETVEAYVNEIEAKGSGVMVMHDEIADMDVVKSVNRTLELTKALIPILISKGYRFVGLDEIDDPQLKSSEGDSFALKAKSGKLLRYDDVENGVLKFEGNSIKDKNVRFKMEDKGHGKITLRTEKGLYLSADPDINIEVKLQTHYSDKCIFDMIPVDGAGIMFRTYNGNYFGGEGKSGDILMADAPFMRQALVLNYLPATSAFVPPVTFAQRINLLKKRLKFIKSKLMQS